jgi:GntR family transcriptional regulator, transcriptional repressor for pyruvate dehydrogenase complex
MRLRLQPLKSESLTDVFIKHFEHLILSGEIEIGQKLPPERELAFQLAVSRPVVHKGLLSLAAKGLVTMRPRVGAVVNDYRTDGSLALLRSLVEFQGDKIDRKLLEDLVALRTLFEVETARLAARHRTEEDLRAFSVLLDQAGLLETDNPLAVAELNFAFHHRIALATGNTIYPLLINSTKDLILNPVGRFYDHSVVVLEVFALQAQLVKAIEARDEAKAMTIMKKVLKKGFPALKGE